MVRNSDRRALRTRKALRDALRELILEKNYDEITVQNIIDRADVGRATFYAYFNDKEALLREDWKFFLSRFIQLVNLENTENDRIVPIKELFARIKFYHKYYRALSKSGKMNHLLEQASKHLEQDIEIKLKLIIKEENLSVPILILANFLANETINLLKWWLEHNMPYSSEKMDEIFHELMTPGFKKVLSNKKD